MNARRIRWIIDLGSTDPTIPVAVWLTNAAFYIFKPLEKIKDNTWHGIIMKGFTLHEVHVFILYLYGFFVCMFECSVQSLKKFFFSFEPY